MSDNTDWNAIVAEDSASAPTAKAATGAAPAAFSNLPPFPDRFAYLVGRLPIKADTSEAIIQLPEAIKGVSCATVMVNSGILSDCYRPAKNCGVPVALRGQPKNDREIRVFLDGDGDKVTGPGWTTGSYPGSQPTTRAIETGVPYAEVVVFVGPDCGCASEDWAADNEWG